MEKRLKVQGEMVLGFVELEKADDTFPREMRLVTLRWMELLEAEVRLVEGCKRQQREEFWLVLGYLRSSASTLV